MEAQIEVDFEKRVANAESDSSMDADRKAAEIRRLLAENAAAKKKLAQQRRLALAAMSKRNPK